MSVNFKDIIVIDDEGEIYQSGPLFDSKGNLRCNSLTKALRILAKYAATFESKAVDEQ